MNAGLKLEYVNSKLEIFKYFVRINPALEFDSKGLVPNANLQTRN